MHHQRVAGHGAFDIKGTGLGIAARGAGLAVLVKTAAVQRFGFHAVARKQTYRGRDRARIESVEMLRLEVMQCGARGLRSRALAVQRDGNLLQGAGAGQATAAPPQHEFPAGLAAILAGQPQAVFLQTPGKHRVFIVGRGIALAVLLDRQSAIDHRQIEILLPKLAHRNFPGAGKVGLCQRSCSAGYK